VKLANVAWGWTPIPEDLPQGNSLLVISDKIRSIGFEGVDYLSTDQGLDNFFNEKNSQDLGKHARDIGLAPNVMVYQEAKWNNPDSAIQKHTLEYFEKCAQTASWIGCNIISVLAPRPFGASGWRLNPRAPAQKESFHLPKGYSYQKDWETLVKAYSAGVKIAKKYGLKMSIECFTMSLVASPNAMVKLLDDVGDADFGIQLDTNHLVAQQTDVEYAIFMLGGKRIFNVHCKDNDGVSRGNIPAGCGIIDYTAVIEALKNVGYEGNLTVELEFTDNPHRYNKQAYDHIKLCVAGEY
jgi:sugar phosphate isomerase/epimerase